MLYIKPVPDADILFTFVTVYLSVFSSFSYCLPVCGEIKLYKAKGSPYSSTEHRVLGLIPVLGSQPAGDVSHKPGGRLPLLSARTAVTLATLKRAAASFAA